MKLKRGKMLVDPPASASSDIAFILIIFFLVCAAVQPETGLAQVLPKTEEKTEQREQSKNITFRLLYGGIDREFLTIPFFRQVNEFVNDIWQQWKTKKYIRTAIDKRVISQEQFPEMNRFKLFNYYLQSLETEFSVRKLAQVLSKLQDTKTQLILYTYDSLLFDVDMSEAKQLIPELREVLQQGNFPVKCKVGDIYSKLTEFSL